MPCSCNSFRCALESLDLAHHQKHHSECELSELSCSHDDMSRLTYVSEQENTFPVPAAAESSEDHKVGATCTVSLVRFKAKVLVIFDSNWNYVLFNLCVAVLYL